MNIEEMREEFEVWHKGQIQMLIAAGEPAAAKHCENLKACYQHAWEASRESTKGEIMIIIDGNELKERDLLWGVVANVKGPSKYRSKRGTERWILVRNAIGCGSTVAHGLCREFGFDPEEMLRS